MAFKMNKVFGPEGLVESPIKQTSGGQGVEEMKANARTIKVRNAEKDKQTREKAEANAAVERKAKIKQNTAIGFDDGSQAWKNKKKAYDTAQKAESAEKFADELKGRTSMPKYLK